MKMPAIKVRGAIACEDLRKEVDGKSFAIGIINPILARQKPREDGTWPPIKLYFILLLDVSEPGEYEMRFRLHPLSGKGGGSLAKLQVEFREAAENIPFPIGPLQVRPAKEAEGFVLEQATEEDNWKRVASWRLEDVTESNEQPT